MRARRRGRVGPACKAGALSERVRIPPPAPCPRSSADRAPASEAVGGWFESSRGHARPHDRAVRCWSAKPVTPVRIRLGSRQESWAAAGVIAPGRDQDPVGVKPTEAVPGDGRAPRTRAIHCGLRGRAVTRPPLIRADRPARHRGRRGPAATATATSAPLGGRPTSVAQGSDRRPRTRRSTCRSSPPSTRRRACSYPAGTAPGWDTGRGGWCCPATEAVYCTLAR
jgi:hypothetical protein